jgi:BRCA1-associated protein
LERLTSEFEEKKALNLGLRDNLESGIVQREKAERIVAEKEAEVAELNDQVRDLMMFFDGKQQVDANPELRDSSIGVVNVEPEVKEKKKSPKQKGKKK